MFKRRKTISKINKDIKRVSKTTKGGRSISFAVLAAIGDGEGKIGLS